MKSHSKTDQRRNSLATFMAYLQFCRENPHYAPCFGNQLRIMDWIDERRIEMEAEGRRHWVPTDWDFWEAMRDCWDDLVQGECAAVSSPPVSVRPLWAHVRSFGNQQIEERPL